MMKRLAIMLLPLSMLFAACNPDQTEYSSKRVNELRLEQGLPELERLEHLDNWALGRSKEMADAGTIYHATDWSGLPSNYTSGRENVGMGSDMSDIMKALEASPLHYASMMGPYTHFGIGVWEKDGVYYITQIFMSFD